jgi:nicotinamidase-related amidase
MTHPTTLRDLSGMPAQPVGLADSTLIMIDCQNTYTEGVMELEGVSAALEQAAELLERARGAGTPIIHFQQDSGPGSPYDLTARSGAIVDRVAPREGEVVLTKTFPDCFVATELDARLRAAGATNLILAGFMTHMCVNSTARGAFSHGYAPTVVAAATATRALPVTGTASPVSAASLQAASLAAIGDLFGIVVADATAIPD